MTTADVRGGASRRVLRRRRQVLGGAVVALVALVVGLVLVLARPPDAAPVDGAASGRAPAARTSPTPAAGEADAGAPDGPRQPAPPQGEVGDGAAPVAAPPSTAPGPTAGTDATAAPDAPPPVGDPAAALAGITGPGVPDVGTGSIEVVPGSADAPDPAADVVRVRVGVEGGLPVAGPAFADLVMATLNDGRSWPAEGYSFARTDGDADVEVILASPQTSAAMCRPLRTGGTLSCHNGGRAIITHYRWVNGSSDYAADLTGYRQYVVNHEVGHYLGRGHVSCPAAGAPAPVMMQQTKGIGACVRNPWPFP